MDVEPARPLPARFAHYFLGRDEEAALDRWGERATASLAAWTLKEAVLKAIGRGLTIPPTRVRIRALDPNGRAEVSLDPMWLPDRPDVAAACWPQEGAVVAVACVGSRLPPVDVSRGAM